MTRPDAPPGAGAASDFEETRLLGGRVICLQPKTGYRTAIDPVFLAAAIHAKAGERVLDVGSGTGAASLCLATRIQGVKITGLEIEPAYAALARKSAELNGLGQHITFIDGDLSAPPKLPDFREFDHVISNPPFVAAGRGRVPPDARKARATAESHVNLEDWIAFCLRMTRSRGTFTMIHRADRLQDILAATQGALGGIGVFPLWPNSQSGKDGLPGCASRVLVSGRKGVQTSMKLMRGLVLHDPDSQTYTREAQAVLNDAGALTLV